MDPQPPQACVRVQWGLLGKAVNGRNRPGDTLQAWVGTSLRSGDFHRREYQHAWSMHGTDWQLRLPNKIMSLKKERLYRKRYTDSMKKEGLFSLYFFDNHFLFKCNEPCKHLSCFVSLFFAISLNFNCLTFLIIFVQFCNFYFCTLGQINECVHSCVTFYFMITYQVERQLNFR